MKLIDKHLSTLVLKAKIKPTEKKAIALAEPVNKEKT